MGETTILKSLFALAELCQFKANELVMELYVKELTPYSETQVQDAVAKIIRTRKATDRFPSIGDIVNLIVPKLSPEIEATEAASRIIAAVSKFGYARGAEAKDNVGPLGWLVVERHGGWGSVCMMLNGENTSYYQAQFRQIALAQYKRAEAGVEGPPQLPEPAKVVQLKKIMEPKKIPDGPA